jgi:hypothetical protein
VQVADGAPRAVAPRGNGQANGCGVRYEPGEELREVVDPRIQEVFRHLLVRFEVTEQVLLCADIPLREKNFAETVRRSDGRAVVAISNVLSEFTDAEVTGMLAHELAHLVAGDPDRPRPGTSDEYLREERDADLKAVELVGRDSMCAAVMRGYLKSIELGFESATRILQNYRDRRLRWITKGTGRCTGAGTSTMGRAF